MEENVVVIKEGRHPLQVESSERSIEFPSELTNTFVGTGNGCGSLRPKRYFSVDREEYRTHHRQAFRRTIQLENGKTRHSFYQVRTAQERVYI